MKRFWLWRVFAGVGWGAKFLMLITSPIGLGVILPFSLLYIACVKWYVEVWELITGPPQKEEEPKQKEDEIDSQESN